MEHTAELTMSEMKNLYNGMAAVILKVVLKELMRCWIRVTRVTLVMVH